VSFLFQKIVMAAAPGQNKKILVKNFTQGVLKRYN